MFNLEQNKFIQTFTIAKDTKIKFNRGNLILSQRISFLKCVLEIVLITILQIWMMLGGQTPNVEINWIHEKENLLGS